MRLTYHADYALRLLVYAALREGELVQIQEVADAYGISKNHLMKVAFQLGKLGFLDTVRGRNGGLRLARPPEAIVIGDVVRKTEEDFTLVECFDSKSNTCVITGPCRLRGVLREALNAYLAVLDQHSLADLVKPRSALSRLLLAS
ncbi:MAG TPA: Rrf2 family transcriptional regulator [Rhizomicrobium sp.]|nr:Rrf2 family transcriptional regulator [Rhizomicrobium sp.]